MTRKKLTQDVSQPLGSDAETTRRANRASATAGSERYATRTVNHLARRARGPPGGSPVPQRWPLVIASRILSPRRYVAERRDAVTLSGFRPKLGRLSEIRTIPGQRRV